MGKAAAKATPFPRGNRAFYLKLPEESTGTGLPHSRAAPPLKDAGTRHSATDEGNAHLLRNVRSRAATWCTAAEVPACHFAHCPLPLSVDGSLGRGATNACEAARTVSGAMWVSAAVSTAGEDRGGQREARHGGGTLSLSIFIVADAYWSYQVKARAELLLRGGRISHKSHA